MDQPIAPPCVVTVLGMHRSGTSLCANVLHALGIDMADEPGVSPDNARGHWERPRINDFNDRVFAALGRRWHDSTHILPLPEAWWADRRVQAVRDEIIAWLAPQIGPGRRFGFKDPRTSRLLPMWNEVFAALGAAPLFVFCVRDPAQVARSIAERDRLAVEQSEYRWMVYNAQAVTGTGAADICIIPYSAWFEAPRETALRLAAHLRPLTGPVDAEARAAEIVDASLRHDAAAAEPARHMSRHLYQSILASIEHRRFTPELRDLCAHLGEFEQLVQPMLVKGEILRASVTDQNRVIGDLNDLIRRLRRENELLRTAAPACP